MLGSVLVWHWIRQSRPEYAAYFLVTGYAAISIISQHGAVYLAWLHSQGEQELMLLMPRRPPLAKLKWIFMIALARTLVLPWILWATVSAVVGAVGWVSPENILFGGAIVLGASCAASADIWVVLARRNVRPINAATVVIVLCTLIGVVACGFGSSRWGLAFILAPTLLAFTAFAVRPLQFPVTSRATGDYPRP